MAAPPPLDRFQLLGTTLDKKFRVEQIVAEGGFGIVYYATHVMLDRPVALKVLKTPPELNETGRNAFIEGFAREAKASVKINHPNIVQVLDFGVSQMSTGEHAPWMALEWLKGRTLREDLVARRGRGGRTPTEALALMRPALEALAYAHDEGIAHRDIKPANMMLVPTRRGEQLKLLDFGIAKVMHEGEEAGSGHTQTLSSLNAFSLSYAAPEQIGGSRTGPWTDVHAMALILTEVLTDRPPYDGRERTEICCDALSSQRPTPAKRQVDVGAWEPVLQRALALRPADRYANAGEFLAALEAALCEAPTGVAQRTGPHAALSTTQARTHVMANRGPGTIPPVAGPSPFAGAPPPFGLEPQGAPPSAHPAPPFPAAPEPADVSNPTTLRGMITTRAPERVAPGAAPRTRVGLLVGVGVLAALLGIGAAVAMRNRPAPPHPAATSPAQTAVPTTPPTAPPVAPTTTPEPTTAPTTTTVVPTATTAAGENAAPTVEPPRAEARANERASEEATRRRGRRRGDGDEPAARTPSRRTPTTPANGMARQPVL